MSANETSQAFWLAYGDFVRDKASIKIVEGGDTAFFLASQAQKGPPAGSLVPEPYGNLGIFNIGNNLLSTADVFYNPSSQNGYVDALETFLANVDLGGSPGEALDTAIVNALKDKEAADKWFAREKSNAKATYASDFKDGFTTIPNLYDWILDGNAPGYITAEKNATSIASRLEALQAKVDGPLAPKVSQDKANIRKAQEQSALKPGFNMEAAAGDLPSSAELKRLQQAGDKSAKPAVYYVPQYTGLDEYKKFVSAAEQKATSSTWKPAQSYDLKIDKGKKAEDYKFGQVSGGGSVAVSCGPWFAFSASANHSETETDSSSQVDTEDVSVKILFDDMRLIAISPGQWNFNTKAYRLREDAPKESKTLARVSQLVVVTGLGYEISLGATSAAKVDSLYKQTTQAGGGLRIFGIPIGLGGSGSKTTETSSHSSSWDSATKTLTIKPTIESGYATVVGVVGEKIQTAGAAPPA
ncbi:hypothetical protein B0T14DRAFT_435058 [Immersiella caudata]|uniref:Uncharacterized protein n=1 Tax=Immersiella caudata TaxID=314043 RepID=A0AA40BWZ7_9PEZI|nr:hypothetical protein B0T14DRAFT_435058 [Immersiella caudata]